MFNESHRTISGVLQNECHPSSSSFNKGSLLFIIKLIKYRYFIILDSNIKFTDQELMINTHALKILIIIVIVSQAQMRVVYPQGLWPMKAFGEFQSSSEQILAYYDFNRDRFVDVLTCVHGVNYELKIYLWSQTLVSYQNVSSINLGVFKPVSVIPADVVSDNLLDLIMAFQSLDSSSEAFQIVIYSITCVLADCKLKKVQQIQPFKSITYPTVFQIRGQNALIYTEENELMFKVNSTAKGFVSQGFVDEYFVSPTPEVKSTVCSKYNNIFYLDYNGDCLQDMIIYCNASSGMADLQFYKGNDKGKFQSDYRAQVRSGLNLIDVAIADINFDGLVDVIQLISDENGALFLQLHYNTAIKQKQTPCQITIHTKTQNYFPFHFIRNEDQFSQQNVLLIERIALQTYEEWKGKYMHSNFHLRTGDINNDGFFDLIIDGPNRAQLYINEQCLSQGCAMNYNPKYMENWALGKIRIFSMRSIDGLIELNAKVCKMSFIDIYEDGRLDLMVNMCPIDSFDKERVGYILPIYNSLPIDAFFLKMTILENLELEKVDSKTMDRKFNVYGAHADFYVTALNGQRIPACGNQLNNPGRSLSLPFIHTGLGRTNNYVEQILVTISGKEQIVQRKWTPIVPNSQLIIVPGPKWVLQTYISPTATMSVVFWFVVLVLILIGGWILKLNKEQRIQDKENQQSFYLTL